MKIASKRNLRVLRIVGFILAGIGVIYLLLLIFAPHQLQRLGSGLRNTFGAVKTRKIVMATAEKGGHYYRLGCLLKREMEEGQNQEVEVLVTQGSLRNLEHLRNGKADFALIQGAIREDQAVNFNGLAAVATIGWQYIHILAPKDSPIKEFKDLAKKKVSVGAEGSGNAALGRLVFNYFPPSSTVQLIYTFIDNIEKDFRAGKMDALFTAYDLHAPVLESLLNTGRYRLVSIPQAKAIAYRIPGCFSTAVPHSLYGPNRNIPPPDAAPFSTLKVNTLLITRAGMNRFAVQDLLQTLYSTRFIKLSGLPELNEENGRKVFDLALHPAADRFYRRNAPLTADKYEIGSAFLAALLFIAGVIGFLGKRYKARLLAQRKENIVPFFEELLQFSKKISDVEDIEQLKKVLDQMMAMQRRAEKEWLKGNLDTEHMENLYTIYGIRCDNAFNKMILLQLIKNQNLLEQLQPPKKTKSKKNISIRA